MKKRKARSAPAKSVQESQSPNRQETDAARSPDSPRDTFTRWVRPVGLFAVTCLAVLTPLAPSESVASQGTGVPLAMLWLVLAALWLLAGLSHRRLEVRFGWTDAGVALLIAWMCLSGVLMAGHGNPRQTLNMLWQWVAFGAGFFLLRQLVWTASECRALHAVMIALAVGLSGLSYYQFLYTMPQQRAMYKQLNEDEQTDWIRRESGIYAPPGSRERELFRNRLESREPIATFALTNSLAGFLAPWLTAAVGIAIANWGRGRERTLTLFVLGIAAVLMGGCLLLTKSRSAALACALGVGLVAMFCRERRSKLGWKIPLLAGMAVAALIAGAVLVKGLDTLVLSESFKSFSYRLEYWQATAGMIQAHPWLGCGPGNFQEYYTAFKLPQASETVADPHNFLLEIWATAGTPALAAALALGAGFGWQLWRAGKDERPSSTQESPFSKPQAGHTLAILVGGLAGMVLAYPYAALVGFPLEGLQIPAALRQVPILGELSLLPAMWFAALPLSIITALLLRPWIESGRLPAALPVCACVALLVNLLAAGGIGFSGVAQSLWLLLAVSLSLVEVNKTPLAMPRLGVVSALLFALGLVLLCNQTAYVPVLAAETQLARARDLMASDTLDEAEAACLTAFRADPSSPEPWGHLVRIALIKWQLREEEDELAWLNQTIDQLEERDKQSSSRRIQIGDTYLQAFRHSPKLLIIEQAIQAYREAIERYPNSNVAHARLAWAYALAQDRDGARREAAEALRLDGLTPHKDQKLDKQPVFDPGPAAKLPPGVPDKPDEANTELLMRRLST